MGSFSKKAVLAAPAFALVLIIGTDTGKSYLRRLATHCVRNVYANAQQILTIPEIRESGGTYIPSYIALCQNWLSEDVARSHGSGVYGNNKDRRLDDSSSSKKAYNRVLEYDATCKDWSAPHSSMMDIISALIVTRFSPSSKYRNNCDRTRVYDEESVGFDHSTIQQALSTPTLGFDDALASEGFVENQCRRALMYFDPHVESARIGSKAHHHCFLWPDLPTKNTDVKSIPNLPTAAHTSPLSMVIVPLVQRYYHAATQWRAVTDKPALEEDRGVVIYLDQLTLGVNYTSYLSYVPPSASSITILSGPLCAKAFLKTGQLCATYAQGLADFFSKQFPGLTKSGVNNGPGVAFQMAASTAAITSRLALAHLTICAPHTTSCYLPALSRVSGSAIVLEDPNWKKAIDFFTITGHQGKVSVVVLDPSLIPPLSIVQPPNDPSLLTCSKKFTDVNTLISDDGYPLSVTVPHLPTDAEILQTTDVAICNGINARIGLFTNNIMVKSSLLEQVPSPKMIQEAILQQQPLYVNANNIGNGWGSQNGRHGELGLDVDCGLRNANYGQQYMTIANSYRADSIARIKHDYEEESYQKRGRSVRSGQDPNNVFEVKCPVTNGPSTIEKFGGGDNGHRQRRMVAVDARTFKFGEHLVKICADVA